NFRGGNMAKQERIINVQPLRTKEEINEMKLAIKRGNKGVPKRPELAQRDVFIFLIGINTGLRVNDIIRLKVGDVRGKNQFVIYEGKTNKRREVNVGMLQGEIERYTEDRHPDEYLFKS